MKNISVFKNDEKTNPNAPDYRMVASYQDGEGNWHNETVASLWKGDKTNPNAPALTGKMSEAREYNGKQYTGYKIEADGVVAPQPPKEDTQQPPAQDAPPITEEDCPF